MNELYKILNLMERIDPQYHRYAAILNEDKRGKAAKKACYNVLRQHFNNAEWLDQEYTGLNNPHHLSTIDWMYDQFIDQFYHENSYQNGAIMRLAPMFLRLALDAGFGQNNENATRINRLLAIENYLHQANKTQDMDLKSISLDMSYEELNNAFGKAMDEEEKAKEERIKSDEYEDDGNYNGYEIVGPLTYEQAHEYGNKSCPGGELCYTQGEFTWEQYTANGLNDVYVLLRDGWENIPAEHDDNGMGGYNGYDRYGLSMIFVFVNSDGKLAYCNTRWNHKARYKPGCSVDHALDEEDISKLIGRNFYKVFKPSNKWEESLNDALERLRNGEDPKKIFDVVEINDPQIDLITVSFKGKYNFMNKNHELLSDKWFEAISNFTHIDSNEKKVAARVRYNGKWNILYPNGDFMLDTWVDWIDGLDTLRTTGVVWFRLNGKHYPMNREGEVISKIGVDSCGVFSNVTHLCRIKNDGKHNYMTTKGEILSPIWFDDIMDSNIADFPQVKLDNKWNLLNTNNGKLICKQWFDHIYNFVYGICRVSDNHKFNHINFRGELISKQWFMWATDIIWAKKYASVISDGKWNFINKNGELLTERGFDEFDGITDNLAMVRRNSKWNYLNEEGNVISRKWFDKIGEFEFGFAPVRLENKSNLINRAGKFISKNWFDFVGGIYEGLARIKSDGKWNYLDVRNGELLLDEWVDYAEDFYAGKAWIRNKDKYFTINRLGITLNMR